MTTTATRKQAKAAAKARHGYLAPGSVMGHGYQPMTRSSGREGTGRLLFHAIGCRVDGGPGLQLGVCLKCSDGVVSAYFKTLMRLDGRAGR